MIWPRFLSRRPQSIVVEQAVYASLPDWDRGYSIVGRSTDCHDTWLDHMTRLARQYGERPRAVASHEGLSWGKVGVDAWLVLRSWLFPADDRGRPDAFGFHGLFLSFESAGWLDFDPLRLEPLTRTDWTLASPFPPMRLAVESNRTSPEPPAVDESDREWIDRLVNTLEAGERAMIESPRPRPDLVSSIWARLSRASRGRLSASTWAYSPQFPVDLAVVPPTGRALSGTHVFRPIQKGEEPTVQIRPEVMTPQSGLPN